MNVTDHHTKHVTLYAFPSKSRDVSRVRHCILGRTRFPFFDAYNMEQRVQLDAEKKRDVYANYKRQEKHVNSVFHKEIEHSHFSRQRND